MKIGIYGVTTQSGQAFATDLVDQGYDVYRFLFLPVGCEEIPIFRAELVPRLKGQQTSRLLWFPVSDLYLRSTRLRPNGDPSKNSRPGKLSFPTVIPTASIHEIAGTYLQFPLLHSPPIQVHYEFVDGQGWVLIVYEGRHRSVGAYLADRTLMIGQLIGPHHSLVHSQKSPQFPLYCGKPVLPIRTLVRLYENDPTV